MSQKEIKHHMVNVSVSLQIGTLNWNKSTFLLYHTGMKTEVDQNSEDNLTITYPSITLKTGSCSSFKEVKKFFTSWTTTWWHVMCYIWIAPSAEHWIIKRKKYSWQKQPAQPAEDMQTKCFFGLGLSFPVQFPSLSPKLRTLWVDINMSL